MARFLYKDKGILLENAEIWQKYRYLGRNDRCACGSGKKYKKCCINFNWRQEVKHR